MGRRLSVGLGSTGTIGRIAAGVSWLFVLVPAALAYLYVRAFGVNVVFADAWEIVPLFRKWFHGQLTFADLYAQHVEHRMFFPRVAELSLGLLTRYNNVAEMYVIVSCFQISFAFAQTFGVIALYLLLRSSSRDPLKRSTLVVALGSATVASFSAAQGLLVWPAGFLQLLLGSAPTSGKRAFAGTWAILGITEWVAYFVGYRTPPGRPPLLYALSHIGKSAEYFLTLWGGALFWQQEYALAGGIVIGCLALGMFLATYGRGVIREHPFWISLLLYSLFILATIALGRSGIYGVWQAALSKYTTFSVLAVASVYAMLAKMVFAARAGVIRTVLLVVLVGTMLLSAGISYRNGVEVGKKQEVLRERAAHVLKTYESQPDARLVATLYYPRPETVRKRAPVLKRLGYNVFSKP